MLDDSESDGQSAATIPYIALPILPLHDVEDLAFRNLHIFDARPVVIPAPLRVI
jgi:hypothetical protein